jgi:hypothetical protein
VEAAAADDVPFFFLLFDEVFFVDDAGVPVPLAGAAWAGTARSPRRARTTSFTLRA